MVDAELCLLVMALVEVLLVSSAINWFSISVSHASIFKGAHGWVM